MDHSYINKVENIGRVRVCLDKIRKVDIRGKIVVDIGSSFGWLEREISKYSVKEIIGIEPNKESINKAKKEVPNIRFINGDSIKTKLPDSYADLVIFFDVIEHVPKKDEFKTLKEIYRILKRDGKLLLSTPNNNIFTNLLDPFWYFGHRHYKLTLLRQKLEENGFEIINADVYGDIYSSIYMDIYYLISLLFRKIRVCKYLTNLYNKGFSKGGIHTIYIEAKKV